MTPLEYLHKKPKQEIEQMARNAGSNYAYFEQIARGHRTPSIKKAIEFVKHSENQMTMSELLPVLKGHI